jgi:hypothetical protein
MALPSLGQIASGGNLYSPASFRSGGCLALALEGHLPTAAAASRRDGIYFPGQALSTDPSLLSQATHHCHILNMVTDFHVGILNRPGTLGLY